MPIGCSNIETNGGIPVFNDFKFKLFESEKVVSLDTEKQVEFNGFFKKMPCQFPIYKVIQHKSYTIFLTIPVGADLPSMVMHYELNHFDDNGFFSDSSTYLYWTKSINESYVSQAVFNVGGNLLSFNVINNDQSQQDSLFSIGALRKRIIRKNE